MHALLLFSLLCVCVPCSYDATAEKSPLFSMNSIKVQRERKIGRRLFRFSRNFYVLVLQQQPRNPTEKRASSCTCRVMFCLLKPIAWMFDFAKAPCYETNRTDISFLFMAFCIITCVLNIRRVSCHQKVISFKLVFQFLAV